MAIPAVFSVSSFGEKLVIKAWNLGSGSQIAEYNGDYMKDDNHYLSVSNGCILEAGRGKPIINIWPMNRYNRDSITRIVTPGKIYAFAATNDYKYLCFTVEKIIYLYQAQSGNVNLIDYHFQNVGVVKFSNDGRTLACGSEDGFLSVWNVGNILSGNTSKPLHGFTDHCLQINDITFSSGVHRPWIISISQDRTSKIYDLPTGNLLISILFDDALTVMAISTNNNELYFGQNNGNIIEINFNEIPENKECYFNEIKSLKNFIGHTNVITSLCVTFDSLNLISGSNDTSIRIWNILTRNCIKIIQEKSPIKALKFTNVSALFFSNDFIPKCVFRCINLNNNGRNKLIRVNHTEKFKTLLKNPCVYNNFEEKNDAEDFEKIQELQNVSKFIYEFSLKNMGAKLIGKK